MEPIKETMRALLQEMILPKLKDIKDTLIRHDERLNSVDKRIDDINTHLIDQSRRIDEVREDLTTPHHQRHGMAAFGVRMIW